MVVLAVAGCLGVAVVGEAQGPPPDPGRRAELLKRYDADGDGKLSPEEMAAMRQAREERRKAGGGEAGNRRGATNGAGTVAASVLRNDARIQALLEEFDRNGDGKLNDEEMDALREAMKQRRARHDMRAADAEQPAAPVEGDHDSR
jgi:Ca2+-binding EF-hand superfamily protein